MSANKSVPDRLTELGDIYRERNKVYGDNYKTFGKFAKAIFPGTLVLETEDDWNRVALLIHCATKLSRYSNSFSRGGHADSLDDIAVYSQMLAETDNEIQKR
jgi:hypothetical protein